MQATALSPKQQQEIQAQVASLLAKSPNISHLTPEVRAQMVSDTERIVEAMAEARPASNAASADPYANLRYATAQGTDVGHGRIKNFTPSAKFGDTTHSGSAAKMMQQQLTPAGSI